ncbi:hypothetical protein GH733_019288 [Mirounga leonina]|nr:hypothetical protein GH733_019288 [Mirounga leonina]
MRNAPSVLRVLGLLQQQQKSPPSSSSLVLGVLPRGPLLLALPRSHREPHPPVWLLWRFPAQDQRKNHFPEILRRTSEWLELVFSLELKDVNPHHHFDACCVLDLLTVENNFIYEESRKLTTKDLVRVKDLEYWQEPNSDPPHYEFMWDPPTL